MKPNPADLTLRNIQAVNKKLAKLAEEIKATKARLKAIEKALKRR